MGAFYVGSDKKPTILLLTFFFLDLSPISFLTFSDISIHLRPLKKYKNYPEITNINLTST